MQPGAKVRYVVSEGRKGKASWLDCTPDRDPNISVLKICHHPMQFKSISDVP